MTGQTGAYGALPGRIAVPAVQRLIQVADQLGASLRARVVFIGASLIPLMETEDFVLSTHRATHDVDAIALVASYTRKFEFEESLRAQGFRNDVGPGTHIDRWHSPDGVTFDCVACGPHTGTIGNAGEAWVFANAVETTLPPMVRHASAVGLLLLKSAAFEDRGITSPITSKDLSDIAAFVATRPELPNEVAIAVSEVRELLSHRFRTLLANVIVADAIRTHIQDRQPLFEGVDNIVLERMRQIAALQESAESDGRSRA